MSDLISRQAALDIAPKLIVTLDGYEMHNQAVANYCIEITQLPPAQPAPSQVAADIARIVENGKDMRVIEAAQPTPDQNGDLWITVPDIDEVTCIYVQESKSKFCRIFYEEQEQPEPHWIPVTERLPEKGNTAYLATIDYGKAGIAVGQRFFFGDNIGWNDEAVVAWMPLPEPYKGVTE